MKAGPKGDRVPEPLDLSMLPPSGARRVAAFAAEFLTVPTGKGASGPFRLRPWQRRIISELIPARGPRPRQAVLSLPRGNGKTSLAAVLATYGLLADGVEGAEVLVVASDQRQAGITFRKVKKMVQADPRLAEQVVEYTDRLVVPATDSTLAVLPSEYGALQGWDPSLCVVDELHVVDRRVWDAVALAAGKRDQSLTLAISTPGASPDGVLWDLVQHGRKGDDPSFRLIEYAAPDGCELDDEQAWAIASPALDDFLYRDALRSTLKTTRAADFRRYRLGQWPQTGAGWLSPAAWQACADPRPIPDGETVVLAVDGSVRGDVVALVAVQAGEQPHVDLVRLWAPPADEPDYQTPLHEVDQAIEAAARRWNVLEVVADPYRWGRTLQVLEASGRRAVEYPQTPQRMTPATTQFADAVQNGTLTHSANPQLTEHVLAAAVKSDDRGVRIVKGSNAARRVDAAVAAIMAHDRAVQAPSGNPGVWSF